MINRKTILTVPYSPASRPKGWGHVLLRLCVNSSLQYIIHVQCSILNYNYTLCTSTKYMIITDEEQQ